MKRTLLLLLPAVLLLLNGCDSVSPTGSERPAVRTAGSSLSTNAGNGGKTDLAVARRFDLDLNVSGSLKQGEPLNIKLKVRNMLDAEKVEIKLLLPEAALARKAKQRYGSSKTIAVPIGEPLPSELAVEGRIENGQHLMRTAKVQIAEPGYYRMLATAHAPDGASVTDGGRWIDNFDSKTLWLWIDEDGGRVTERFDLSLFPEGARQQPGPLTLRSEPWRFRPAGQASTTNGSGSGRMATASNSDGPIDATVSYIEQASGATKIVPEAKVEVTIYEGRNDQAVNSYTRYSNEQGEVTLSCPGYGYYAVAKIYAEDSDVYVNDTYNIHMGRVQFDDTDCGDPMVLNADSEVAHTYITMRETIEKSRNFFLHSRGKIHVLVASDGSYYDPNADEIVIEPDDADGRAYSNWVVAHEYGHAFHEKGLGGNEGSGNCPSPHYLRGAHNLQCAFSEGFANYHGAVVFDNYVRSNFESNDYYPATRGDGDRDDGSIIEGAVAAFLFDFTDSANESHDNVDSPGRYVADIVETCEVDGDRADGVDHLVACFQRNVPNYSDYFLSRYNPPSSFSEGATEPSGWSRLNVRKLWHKNLYGENYDGPPLSVSMSGSSHLESGEEGSWTATASNGGGSYSYQWYYIEGTTSTPIGGDSRYLNYTFYASGQRRNLTVKVEVSSGDETESASQAVSVAPPGCGSKIIC